MAVGGTLSEGLDIAAQLGVLGLDPLRFLNSTDSIELNLMIRLAELMQHYKSLEQHNQAVEIANQVSKLLK